MKLHKDPFGLAHGLDAIVDFPKPGIVFQDISPLLKNHFQATIDAMAQLFTEQEWAQVDCLVGVESRGFIFASALAYKLDKGVIKARKPGKLPNVAASVTYGLEYGDDQLEMQQGDGKKVIILDDLIATGGSMQAAAQLCEKVGYEVVGMGCVIDLKPLNQFAFRGKTVRALIEFTD